MPRWDYSGNGIYFLTIVTKNRECNLGKIVKKNGRASVELSGFGKIVETEFLKSFKIRDELFLDEYIIMPNHLHAIIILKKTIEKTVDDSHDLDDLHGSHGTHGTHGMHGMHGTHGMHVETHGRASLQSPAQFPAQFPNEFKPQKFIRLPKSISSFVAGFKSATNSKIDDYIDEFQLDIPKYNKNNPFFQPNYHDRIIRNNTEYEHIKNYIINNPVNWENDKFKPENEQ